MFIVYEIRSYHHKTIHLPDQACPLCQAKAQLQLHMMQKYGYWFGPLTPIHKYAVLECQACDKTIPINKWNDVLDALYKKHKAEVKTPLKLWQNMIVIPLLLALFTLYTLYGNKIFGWNDPVQTIEDVVVQAKNVKVGDVMFVTLNEPPTAGMSMVFGLVKIEKIVGDNVSCKLYSKRWGAFQDLYTIKKSDVDSLSLAPNEVHVSLNQITKNQQLMRLDGGKAFIGSIDSFITK
jgi:hypothetical protein